MTPPLRNPSGTDIRRPRGALGAQQAEPNAGLQVNKHHGIWQVRVDGVFHGDYHQEEPARAAAALLRGAAP